MSAFSSPPSAPGQHREDVRTAPNPVAGREMRVARSVDVRKRSRGAATKTKRRRLMEAASPSSVSWYCAADVSAALGVLLHTSASGQAAVAESVRKLRVWLSYPSTLTLDSGSNSNGGGGSGDMQSQTNDVALRMCAERGLAKLLLPVLAQEQRQAGCEQVRLDAVWCITNVASGNAEQTASTVVAAPALMSLLTSGQQALQEQAAWGLGNMAGDSDEHRAMLRSMGLLAPLVILLRRPGTQATLSLKRTVAWVMCNLTRGINTPGAPFFESAAHLALLETLALHASSTFANADVRQLIVEVLWTFSFLSSKDAELCKSLVHHNVIELLLVVFREATTAERLPTLFHHRHRHCTTLPVDVIVPLLRTLSNLMPLDFALDEPSPKLLVGPGDHARRSLVAAVCEAPGFLEGLLKLLQPGVRNSERALTKEAMWALSNCCAMHGDVGAQSANSVVLRRIVELFVEPVKKYFMASPRDWEMQRDAAFVLQNLAAREDPSTLVRVISCSVMVDASGLKADPFSFSGDRRKTESDFMKEVLSLLQSEEEAVQMVALDLVESVLQKLNNPFGASMIGGRTGVRLVLDLDGIDRLEELQWRQGVRPCVGNRAAAIVDTYFGVDFEDDEDVEGDDDAMAMGMAMGSDLAVGMGFETSRSVSAPAVSSQLLTSVNANLDIGQGRGRGRGRDLLVPAWKAREAQEAHARQQQQVGYDRTTQDDTQKTLPDYFNMKMQE